MSDEIRVLVLSPPSFRVVNRAAYRALADKGVKVHLAAPHMYFAGGRWLETEIAEPDSYDISYLRLVGEHPRLQRMQGLRDLVRRFRPTHIYVDADPASLLVLQAAWAGRGALVTAMTAENLMPEGAAKFWQAVKSADLKAAINVLLKASLRIASRLVLDRVFTLSEDGSAVAKRLGFTPIKIPLGYDPALFVVHPPEKREKTRQALGLNAPTVAYFGRQTPEKGVHVLIEALSKLQHLNWQVLLDRFVEDGGYAQSLKTQITKTGLDGRTVYFESSHADMPLFMNAADIVVLPSLSTPSWKEQYGRVIQEAMACGRVVAASRSGAIPETMDGHGVLVPEGDAEALAEKLSELILRAPEVDKSAAEAASRLRTVNTQADIIARYLNGG